MHEPSANGQPAATAYGNDAIFQRSARLLGNDCMHRLAGARIIILGLGGVGSWCAESLVRTGVRHLTIVDSDRICVTNINRQLQATCSTVGQVKTDALKARLLDINPHARITAVQKVYDRDTQAEFDLDAYDVVIDAIDSLHSKVLLLHNATRTHAEVFSSFGAALKLDPTRIRTAELWSAKGCPLGSKLRKLMRRENMLPAKEITVVYSDEVLENAGDNASCGTGNCLCPRSASGPGQPELLNHEWCSKKAVINGSLAHITGIFGLTLAGLVIQRLYAAPVPSAGTIAAAAVW
jgi:tRNA A37 threonylcarbamoyladenosine dehydratase